MFTFRVHRMSAPNVHMKWIAEYGAHTFSHHSRNGNIFCCCRQMPFFFLRNVGCVASMYLKARFYLYVSCVLTTIISNVVQRHRFRFFIYFEMCVSVLRCFFWWKLQATTFCFVCFLFDQCMLFEKSAVSVKDTQKFANNFIPPLIYLTKSGIREAKVKEIETKSGDEQGERCDG